MHQSRVSKMGQGTGQYTYENSYFHFRGKIGGANGWFETPNVLDPHPRVLHLQKRSSGIYPVRVWRNLKVVDPDSFGIYKKEYSIYKKGALEFTLLEFDMT